MQGRPKKGSASRQRWAPALLLANLVSSLVAAEGITTTRPRQGVAPDRREGDHQGPQGRLHNHRQILAYLGDQEIAAKLMDDIGRATSTPAATPSAQAGSAPGDNAPMARIELV